jgi:formylglycine-generating enzyme required for sulfatase activity
LPSEAEWEYSCRGGASSHQIFSFGDCLSSKQANFDGNYPYGGAEKGSSLNRTCQVGSYPANGFGLMDMHGNVGEWCADWSDEGYYARSPREDPPGPSGGAARVLRGGNWRNIGSLCRSANRYRFTPAFRSSWLGFRGSVVLSGQ